MSCGFCNNFLQRLSGLFDTTSVEGKPLSQTADLLASALFGELGQGLAKKAAIGQFLPGGAGGANSTNGPDGDSLLNAWDFVLMLEGTLLFASTATRRMATNAGSRASAPFVLSSHAIGYPGANPSEEEGRGEQWMPLWDAPMTLPELRVLLAEGRAQMGTKPAERPLDAARAIARLGVARGLTGFQRYGYLERNGQANLAVPLGLIEVRARPQARLIDDLADWLDRLRRTARDKGAPTRLQQAERTLADAVFSALTHEDEPARWQGVLSAAVQIEALQSTGSGIAAGPIPELSPEWLSACNDGSATFRLAACLGSTWAPKLGDKGRALTLRGFWLPLDAFGRFKTSDKRLMRDAHVVCWGRDGVADAIALQLRLGIEATAQGERTRTLRAAPGLGATLTDLTSLLSGAVSLDDVLALARAFMAIRWRTFEAARISLGQPRAGVVPPPAWCALKLLFSPSPFGKKWILPADPTILRRLEAGELSAALRTALDRLRMLGLVPTLHTAVLEPELARLWAASLLFPLEERALRLACSCIDPSFDLEIATKKETLHADD